MATPAHTSARGHEPQGNYLVRLVAAFEAALRSYDRARHSDPTRNEQASVLIDTTGGRRGQGIPFAVRAGRTRSAVSVTTGHTKADAMSEPMTIANAWAQCRITCPGCPRNGVKAGPRSCRRPDTDRRRPNHFRLHLSNVISANAVP